jgi:hypothetical protein
MLMVGKMMSTNNNCLCLLLPFFYRCRPYQSALNIKVEVALFTKVGEAAEVVDIIATGIAFNIISIIMHFRVRGSLMGFRVRGWYG